jgi:hypothetical protein
MNGDRVRKDIARQYGSPREQVLDRSNRETIRMAVFRRRREAKLPKEGAAALARVSVPRISQVRAEIE